MTETYELLDDEAQQQSDLIVGEKPVKVNETSAS